MPRPFDLLDSVDTKEGLLELRRRGTSDFMILVGGRVLMTSMLTSSELALAEHGCARLAGIARPRVLIGGMGLGFTLKATLTALPRSAHVVVAELNPKVVEWCRGPVKEANGGAALDKRVAVAHGDVMDEVKRVAEAPEDEKYDAILWDLYVGPTRKGGGSDPLYGDEAVATVHAALKVGGTFGVWSETPSGAFFERLRKVGFQPEVIETRGAGLRHAVILATRKASKPAAAHGTRKKKARGVGPRRR